jgi:hypothetical protein
MAYTYIMTLQNVLLLYPDQVIFVEYSTLIWWEYISATRVLLGGQFQVMLDIISCPVGHTPAVCLDKTSGSC